MIRINLGRTRIQEAESLESVYGGSADSGVSSPLGILLKVTIMAIGVVALHFYEGSIQEELSAEAAQVNQQVMALQTTLDQQNQELASLGEIQGESKALQDKMKLLKDLSQLRLREVKSLDYIQTVIPQRVWLISLNVEKQMYVIKGRSTDEIGVSVFMDKLEEGGYFSDVVLIQDTPMNQDGVEVREFELLARSEVVN